MDRDRSSVINEALDRYLEMYAWQEAHIREGLEQAQSGQLVGHPEVVNKWEARLR